MFDLPLWAYPASVSAACAAWLGVRWWRRWRAELAEWHRAGRELQQDSAQHQREEARALREAVFALRTAAEVSALCAEPEGPPMREAREYPLEDTRELASNLRFGGHERYFVNGNARHMAMDGSFWAPQCYLLTGVEARLVAPPGATAADRRAVESQYGEALFVTVRVGVRDYYDGPLAGLPLDYRDAPIFIPPRQQFCVEVRSAGGFEKVPDSGWRLKVLLRGKLGIEAPRCGHCGHSVGPKDARAVLRGGRHGLAACRCQCHDETREPSW